MHLHILNKFGVKATRGKTREKAAAKHDPRFIPGGIITKRMDDEISQLGETIIDLGVCLRHKQKANADPRG